jgi:hypothetical protein
MRAKPEFFKTIGAHDSLNGFVWSKEGKNF